MLIQEELKNSLEYVSGVSAYPNNIPASADLPAIVYKNTGFRRNADSSLCKIFYLYVIQYALMPLRV